MATTRVGPTTVAPPERLARGREGDRRVHRDVGVATAFSHLFLLGWALLTTFPLAWALLSSFKTDEEILNDPWGLPSALRWKNWVRAWNEAHIGRYILNSVVVVTGSLTLTMLFGAMAAYVLARYEFRGSRIVYYVFVGGMMFPVYLAWCRCSSWCRISACSRRYPG